MMRRRRMTRSFSSEPVAATVLDELLAAALRAPSAGFSQGIDLLCLTSPAARRRFWESVSDPAWREAGPQAPGLQCAPVVVVPIADPTAYIERYAAPDKGSSDLSGRSPHDWDVPYWLVDAAFATMTVLAGATDAGLGALFFRLHRPEAVLFDAFGVPEGRRTIGALALGHPAGPARSTSPARRRRRTAAEAVHSDRW